LLAAAIAPVVFPDSISKLVVAAKAKASWRSDGVPDASQRRVSHARWLKSLETRHPRLRRCVIATGEPNCATETQASPNAATTPNPFHVAPADVQQLK